MDIYLYYIQWYQIILFLCDLGAVTVDIVDMYSKISMEDIKNINLIDEVFAHINIGK